MRAKASVIQALLAAFLFGMSAPLSKLLLEGASPVMLSSLLYLGSGGGMLCYMLVRKSFAKEGVKEPALEARDLPWLLGSTLFGGILAPISLLLGLEHTSASVASLLLNFEIVATTLIAAVIFREWIGKRVWAAMLLILMAGIVLSFDTWGKWKLSAGALGLLLSCIFWGMDNNLSRRISNKDPSAIAVFKGLTAGATVMCIGLVMGDRLPDASYSAMSLLLGFLSYGVSLVFFLMALRGLGASRTSAYFSSAPFIGATVSLIIFLETPSVQMLISLPFLVIGLYLMFTERHLHAHLHTEMRHEHVHRHDDEHHDHLHDGGAVKGPHSHFHAHRKVEHVHEHAPDLHHRHVHRPLDGK